MSSFAAQFMTGPVLKKSKETPGPNKGTRKRCVRCGEVHPAKQYITPPHDMCQHCVVRQKLAQTAKDRKERKNASKSD